MSVILFLTWSVPPLGMRIAYWRSETTESFIHFYALWCDTINGNAYVMCKAVLDSLSESKLPAVTPSGAGIIGGIIVAYIATTLVYVTFFFIPNLLFLYIASCF